MAAVADKIWGMSKDKKPKRGRPPGRRPSTAVYVRLNPELADVFDRHVDSLRPKTTTTGVVSMLIEDWLRQQGLWPPQNTEG